MYKKTIYRRIQFVRCYLHRFLAIICYNSRSISIGVLDFRRSQKGILILLRLTSFSHIVHCILSLFKRFAGIDAIDIVDSEEDISLKERVKRANNLHAQKKNCIYVSMHSDAFSDPQAHGYSIYTSVGQTESDAVASAFLVTMKDYFPDRKLRHDNTDGDEDKEAHFYVLKKTTCPAILIENFFYTNPTECKLLLNDAFQDKIVTCHMDSIKRMER